MTLQEENDILYDAINTLENAPWAERKKLLRAIAFKGEVEINGYIFNKELHCYLIWKPTDIGEKPEYKGEPLLKVLPYNVPLRNVKKVLSLQPWMYQ